jgi:hypothetical protein
LIAIGVISSTVIAMLFWRPMREAARKRQLDTARLTFRQQRERLEAVFFQMAANSGKPRGLRWMDCDFRNDVTFARERDSGALSAFVGVTIRFEAIEGGGMEDVEAVGNLRAATAVFLQSESGWTTNGRVIMNLEPVEAVERFHQALEMISEA